MMKKYLAALTLCMAMGFPAACLAGQQTEELAILSGGDRVYREEDTVVVEFRGARDVVSSSVINGGYRKDLSAVLNNHYPGDQPMTVDAYISSMNNLIKRFGYDPLKVSPMGTGVPMRNVVIKTAQYKEFVVTAVVTAGAEGNPGRVGDKAFYDSINTKKMPSPGTINIILHMNADMPPGVLTRAIVTATEAKTAALQELILGSRYSQGLATGTGTDQIIVISNPQAKFSIGDTGKHTKPGELIGRVVKDAVKEALFLQNGFSGEKMHDIDRRMSRFGISKQRIFADYNKVNDDAAATKNLESAFKKLNNDGKTLVNTSLLAHLLDQYNWGLLSFEETSAATDNILRDMCDGSETVLDLNRATVNDIIGAWEKIILDLLEKEVEE